MLSLEWFQPLSCVSLMPTAMRTFQFAGSAPASATNCAVTFA
ncbi:hypothetical protein ACLEPN_08490 [Myxococcus sp. 1LA]